MLPVVLFADPSSRGSATCRALKQAHRSATERAFSRLVVVRLEDGRIYVDATAPESASHDVIRDAEFDPVLQVCAFNVFSQCLSE